MAMRKGQQPLPVDYGGETWPVGPIDGPPVAHQVRLFVLALRTALTGRSVREVGRDADVAEGTIRRILLGTTWPDVLTVGKLEAVLGPLWPPPMLNEVERSRLVACERCGVRQTEVLRSVHVPPRVGDTVSAASTTHVLCANCHELSQLAALALSQEEPSR